MNVTRHAGSLLLALAVLATGCRSVPQTTAEPAEAAAPETTTEPADTAARVTPAPTQTPTPTNSRDQNRLAAGDYTISLRQGNRSRSYIMHIPETLPNPAPLLLGLHGGGGTGLGFQEENGFDEIADREGFIAVYPEGTGVLPNRLHTWNSGATCCGFALDRDVDDVAFLRDVLADVSTKIEVDPGRVYVTGHSNGAMMAYRFAAEAPELVTAIAPVGGAPDIPLDNFSPAVAVLHIHSVDDPRALYEGGEGPPFPGTDRTVHHEPVLPGIEIAARANGCAPDPTRSETIVGTGVNQGHTVDNLSWSSCNDGVTVQHLILAGSGHGWPGVTNRPALQRHLGPPTSIIHASEEAWAFLSQFER